MKEIKGKITGIGTQVGEKSSQIFIEIEGVKHFQNEIVSINIK